MPKIGLYDPTRQMQSKYFTLSASSGESKISEFRVFSLIVPEKIGYPQTVSENMYILFRTHEYSLVADVPVLRQQ